MTPQPRPHLDAFCCNTIDGGRAVLRTAELDAGKGTDAATDHVDEQCRAATNQQLSHPRSRAAAAVEDTDHRADGEQGEASQEDRGTLRKISVIETSRRLGGKQFATCTSESGERTQWAAQSVVGGGRSSAVRGSCAASDSNMRSRRSKDLRGASFGLIGVFLPASQPTRS